MKQFKAKKFLMVSGMIVFVLMSFLFVSFGKITDSKAFFFCTPNCITCAPFVMSCAMSSCACQSNVETPVTIDHITQEFIDHREWIIKVLWEAHTLPAMMLMTEQITTFAMHQMLIVGSLFDAKHQLETQRLLQEMQAQAHKDYQPSEGMCQFGTNTRSLAASDRNSDFTQIALASRSIQRQLLSGDGISSGSFRDDSNTRLDQFKKTYCNPEDFGHGLSALCDGSTVERYNKDVNFTHTIDSVYNLEIDFSEEDTPPDEEDVMALSANLYGHRILPRIGENYMVEIDSGRRINAGAGLYMDTRALTAKRSVAQTTYAAHVAMKTQGEAEVKPYMEAILKEMGINEEQIETLLGERPSYYAQMEFLTKKMYQTPNFYTDLYDKPVNIDRKNVSMQAFDLMQKRDMYRSQLRSEAMMAVWLETALKDIENLYVNEANAFIEGSEILDLPLD